MKNNKWMYPALLFSLSCALIVIISCCTHEHNTPTIAGPVTHPYKFPTLPYYFPTAMNIPADNPMTIEGVKLGRYLYYDSRIDGNPGSPMCCATCHVQANAFVCGINNPKFIGGQPYGTSGIPTNHYMLPHINLVFDFNGYLWTGEVNNNNPTLGNSPGLPVPAKEPFNWRNLESVVWLVIYLPTEMNTDSTHVLAALNSVTYPDYKTLFYNAFGSKTITMDHICKAIAQFMRTLISYNSNYDKAILGKYAYTPSESRGHDLFVTEPGDCFHCHGNPALLTNNLFMNNAKDSVYNPLTNDVEDRFSYTHDSADIGCYVVPTLRNIALTAPYMHDGRYKTLQDVVNHYSSELIPSKYVSPLMLKLPYGGDQFTQPQIDDLIAYLKTFTDYQFISDTNFGKPSDLP